MNTNDTNPAAEPDADAVRGIELARSAVRLLRGSDTGHRVRVGTMALGSLTLIAVAAPLSDQLRPTFPDTAPTTPQAPNVPIATAVMGVPTPQSPSTSTTPPAPLADAAPTTRPTPNASLAKKPAPQTPGAAPATPKRPARPHQIVRRPPASAAPVAPHTPSATPPVPDAKSTSSLAHQANTTIRPPVAEYQAATPLPLTSSSPVLSTAEIQAMIERVVGLLDELRGPATTTLSVLSSPPTTLPPRSPIGLPSAVTPPAVARPPTPPAVAPPPVPPTPPAPPALPLPARGGQVGQWIAQATAILAANGVPASEMNPHDIAVIIQHESAGNPRAINRTDANARAGHPSKGLMQTIDTTFNRYKLPGHNDIYNPVDNIIAGVRYAIATYGSASNVPGLRSMASGHEYRGY